MPTLSLLRKKSTIINLAILLLLAVAIPVAFNLASQSQILRSRAASDAVTFSGTNVFQKDSKDYLKPVKVDPSCEGSLCQYKYEVSINLNPPDISTSKQSYSKPQLMTVAYAQAIPSPSASSPLTPQQSEISCTPTPATAASGQTVVWNVRYPSKYLAAAITLNDPSASPNPISQTPTAQEGANWKVSFQRSYVQPTQPNIPVQPTVSINLGGGTTPKYCEPLNVTSAPSPSPSPIPSPSPSPAPHACTYDQNCVLIPDKNFTGSKYCVIPNKTQCVSGDVVNAVCAISVDDPSPGCGVSPASIISSCTPSTTKAALGSTVTWTIKYNSSVANFLTQTSLLGDANIVSPTKTGAEARGTGAGNGQNAITFTSTYSQPGQFTPKVTLDFGSLGKTYPQFNCSTLTVGTSGISANITGTQSLTSGTEGAYTLNITETNTDPLLALSKIELYAARADGVPMTQVECPQGLISGNCRVFSATSLPRAKTYSNSAIKWKPYLPQGTQNASYYLYAYAESSLLNSPTPASVCTGKRGDTASTAPCDGTSSLDITVNIKPAYTSFKIATSLNDLDSSAIVQASNINSWPQQVLFPPIGTILNDWQSPGSKVVYVKFIANTGQELVVNKTINLTLADPQIKQARCDLSVDGKNLNITLRGYNFGLQTGAKLSVSGKDISINKWLGNRLGQNETDLVLASLPSPGVGADSNKTYPIKLTRLDGAIAESQCSVGASALNLGAKMVCRGPNNFDQADVELTLVNATSEVNQAQNKLLKKKVTISKDGTIQGLDTLIQACNYYKLGVKAPSGLRRVVEFQALEGTTSIPDFRLPTGDIFPAGGDGKINSLDRAEIIRQWAASLPSVRGQSTATGSAQTGSSTGSFAGKTGDLNRDGVINSFDFACMVYDFNKEDDPEPKAGSVDVAKLGDLCQLLDETIPSPSPVIVAPTTQTTVTPFVQTSFTGSSSVTIPDILGIDLSCSAQTNELPPKYEHGYLRLLTGKIYNILRKDPNKVLWLAIKDPATSKIYFTAYSIGDSNPESVTLPVDAKNPLPFVESGESYTLSPNKDYRLQAWLVTYKDQDPVQISLVQEKPFRLNACPQPSPSVVPSPSVILSPPAGNNNSGNSNI